MKTKLFFVSIMLVLGPLVFLMLPVMSLLGPVTTYAQSPFKAATVGDVSITATTGVQLEVGGTGTTEIILVNDEVTSPVATPLKQVEVEIYFPAEYVQIESDADVRTTLGTIQVLRRDNISGYLLFEVEFNPGLDTTLETVIATIDWLGINYSYGPKPVEFGKVEVRDEAGGSSPVLISRKYHGDVEVIRPDITVYIDEKTSTPGICEISLGETFVTRVYASDVVNVDEVFFELTFDPRFVQVNEVRPGSFFDPTPIELPSTRIDNNMGSLIFHYQRASSNTSEKAFIAEIEWEGHSPGRSYQHFVPPVVMRSNGANVEVDPTDITELNGCDIAVTAQEITIALDPPEITLVANYKPVHQAVTLTGVRLVDEVSFRLEFDPTLVQVVDASGDQVTEIAVGELFRQYGYFVKKNVVDNRKGTIEFSVNANEDLRRDGIIADIYWKGLRTDGPSDLTFEFVEMLAGPDSTIGNQYIIKEHGEVVVQPGLPDSPVYIHPGEIYVNRGENTLTHVQLENIDKLSEAEIEIHFDPTILQALSVAPSTLGGEITSVSLGNSTGVVRFRVSNIFLNNSSGSVSLITWQAIKVGGSNLTLDSVRLVQRGEDTYPTTLSDGRIIVDGDGPVPPTPGPGGGIFGVIASQGKQPNFAGVQIYVSNSGCTANLPSGSPAATTGQAGEFNLAANSSYQCLTAYREGYLTGQKASPAGNIGALELPAGDLNGDNKIDIYDLVIIGQVYDQPHAVADYNEDGKVDIYDLGLLAGNYGKSGPVSDWK